MNFGNSSLYEGSYDKNFAKAMSNFVAAAFIPPQTINSAEMAQQCFENGIPNVKWEKPVQYIRNSCAGYFNGECQLIITRSVIWEMVIIAFRGTIKKEQMNIGADKSMTTFIPWKYNKTFGNVNKYFFAAAENMWEHQIESYLNKNDGYLIVFTGHSIGGAIASLSALKASQLGLVDPGNIMLYTFGEPRIGDYSFAKNFQSLVPGSYRVIHNSDIVPHLPLCDVIINDSCKNNASKAYHQPQEIWYNSPNLTMSNTKFKICDENNGEDPNCSNSISAAEFVLNVDTNRGYSMHLNYFNHNLEEYGNKGCPLDILPTTTTPSNSAD
uniref:Fungal lipase-like domain-containing protein n=2 Tax=Panagrolaimus sp. PS1159 TaxID=55785 RepID=A0AC35GQ17_9BILA